MRTAYRGRAAAYEKKSDYAKALADHDMVVTYYGIEVEILESLESPDRAKMLAEAAAAYLARSECLKTLARAESAQRDRDRANSLLARAEKLIAVPARESSAAAGKAVIINGWSATVSLVVEGATHRIEPGTQKEIPLPAASVSCQVRAGAYLQSTILHAGKTYTIR